MFMCKAHWFMLPKAMRDRIWATYRPGQCDDWHISHEYAEAAREAVRYIAWREGKTPDVSVYDMLDPARTVPISQYNKIPNEIRGETQVPAKAPPKRIVRQDKKHHPKRPKTLFDEEEYP
jgi:hypothetical protein